MYKKYVKKFMEERDVRELRLRRSSRSVFRESKLILEYNIQQHMLYRGEELRYVLDSVKIYLELEKIMCAFCPLLTGKVGEELLLPYLLPDVMDTVRTCRSVLHEKSKDVMCSLLNVCGCSRSKSKLHIYLDHCPEGEIRLFYQCRMLNSL